MLLAEKKRIELDLAQNKAELSAVVRITNPPQLRGYDMFVKTVSSEILKQNPSAKENPSEVQRIVQDEWNNLSDEQRKMYEKISHEANS